jgi:hypothetical protein
MLDVPGFLRQQLVTAPFEWQYGDSYKQLIIGAPYQSVRFVSIGISKLTGTTTTLTPYMHRAGTGIPTMMDIVWYLNSSPGLNSAGSAYRVAQGEACVLGASGDVRLTLNPDQSDGTYAGLIRYCVVG